MMDESLFSMESELALTNISTLVLSEAKSYEDPVLLNDVRVLSNILVRQDIQVKEDYFETVQSQIKPHMRKIVSDWMLEVCEDQKCQAEVFSLAVNYMDRFLSKVNIQKSQFQLLASVCIFLASKFKETAAIPAENLVIYTDHSVNCQDLTQWELIVLNVLDWDLSSVTPYGILDQLLRKLSFGPDFKPDIVRRHAETFVALAATEYSFYGRNPSVIAVSCLGSALRGLHITGLDKVLNSLRIAIGVDSNAIQDCMNQVEESISHSLSGLSFQPISTPPSPVAPPPTSSAPKIIPQHYNGSNFVSTTPTDVMDISSTCVY